MLGHGSQASGLGRRVRWIITVACGLWPVALLMAPMPPCTALPRAGVHVSGDVRICPGTYRIADPHEGGVLVVTTSDTRLDLSGVTIESGDSVPARFTGVGILVQGADRVTITGGRIRGYRWGIRLEGGTGHRVEDLALSGSRAQRLRSTDLKYDEKDTSVIRGLRRISSPGRRVYVNKGKLPRVMGGMGMSVVSSSGGVLSDKEARERGVGGELLCYVW